VDAVPLEGLEIGLDAGPAARIGSGKRQDDGHRGWERGGIFQAQKILN
jgi:hypothetical protein